ncbi:MAG: type IV toxin-antitoxin system AbiEi family antitoxin [Lentisphaeria bacterium]|nr:type IV toxin-antitoxin system AbiEi family antitoxin [Lentisphaeria bacterium]
MARQTNSKINQLLRCWPEGAVGTMDWLREHDMSRKLADWHVRSGWLDRIGRGAFVRGGDKPDWTGGLYALQSQLGLTVHVGGRSALELQGRAHFVPLGRKQVLLVSDEQERLPSWFANHDWGADVSHRCMSLFDSPPRQSLTTMPCGRYEVTLSARERAIMEYMHLAKTNADVEHAHELMAGLGLLRPDIVQPLLERCTSVKVKRLFLWSAEDAQHPWVSRLNASKITLGKGKRQIYKGGQLSAKYDITVPPGEELPNV